MKCFIFCAGEIKSYDWLKNIDFQNSFIICADGGQKHLEILGTVPDVWMGDGDSLKKDEPIAKKIVKVPAKKDNTDTDLAVIYAIENGFKDITIIGALGGRFDHEFSHICLLKKILDNGGEGEILDEKNYITLKNKSFVISSNGMKYASFFPFGGDVRNFSVKNMLYEAEGITLHSGEVQASSNQFLDEKPARITFDNGLVLVVCSDD